MRTSDSTVMAPRPAAVAGVVDGSLITAARLGAGLCLYVTLGGGTPRDDHPIEFVPTAEAATALRRTLLDEGGAAFEVPCRVGLRLRDA